MKFHEFIHEFERAFNKLEFEIDKCKSFSDIDHVKRLHDSLYGQCIGFAAAIKFYENEEIQKQFLRDMFSWSHNIHQLISAKNKEIITENSLIEFDEV